MKSEKFGLKHAELEKIAGIISKFQEVEKAVLFGSRAKGNFKAFSDIDIAIWQPGKEDIAFQLSGKLNDETLMPYKFDILNYYALKNVDLIEHINRVGKIIYLRE